MRPKNIIMFERLVLASLALGPIQTLIGWQQLMALGSIQFVLGIQAFTIGVILLLTFLVSRRRSKVAMWILIVMFVLGVPMIIKMFTDGVLVGASLITLAQTLAQLLGIILLFTPASRSWMRERPA